MNKKLILLLGSLFMAREAMCQNVPASTLAVPGTVTNVITPPTDYSLGTSPAPVFNYTKTYVPQFQVSNESLINDSYSPGYMKEQTTYTDGFGRTMEKIDRYISPGRDLITPYNNIPSTNHFSYLPYPSPPNTSTFDQTPFTNQTTYYTGLFPDDAGTAMSETSYRSSAITGGYTLQLNPGKSNVGQLHGTETTSNTNAPNEVMVWSISTTGQPQKTGYYVPGLLTKKIIISADGEQVNEFYDNDNKLICKSILASANACSGVTYTHDATATTAYGQGVPTPATNAVVQTSTTTYPTYLGVNLYSTPNDLDNMSDHVANLNVPSGASPWSLPYPVTINPGLCPVYLLTYYVYDIYDRLTYVLHPKAMQYLEANSWTPTSTILNNLCDFVVFDNLGRVASKHKAGENGNENRIYDRHNRVVCTQNPADGAYNWRWNHYDQLNRITETGTVTVSGVTATTMQSWFDNSTLPSGYNTASSIFYYLYNDNQQGVYPSVAMPATTVYSWNFFDNYNYSSYYDENGTSHPLSAVFSYDNSIFAGNTQATPSSLAYLTTASTKTKGLQTFGVSKVFKPSGVSPLLNPYISDAYYYDNFGRVVENVEKNALTGTTKMGNQYDFTGRVLTNISNYNNPFCATPNVNIVTHNYYNIFTMSLSNIGRSINGSTERVLASYTYNDLGQTVTKGIGGTVEYEALTYNIRNQLTGINPAYVQSNTTGGNRMTFGECIQYDGGFTTSLYSGKVTGIQWRTAGYPVQSYGYTYDYAGRLIQSDFRESSVYPGEITFGGVSSSITGPVLPGSVLSLPPVWNKVTNDYTEGNISYDLNDNITKLVRYGPLGAGSFGQIDNLGYTYTNTDISNQQQAVSDAVATTTPEFNYDFKDNNTTATDYSYTDGNGNQTADLNKGTTTTYYYFNKPQQITFANGDYIQYIYDCDGNKLEDISHIGSTTTTTDYLDGVNYVNSALDMISNPEGYSIKDGSAYDYYFYVKDHLGNVRTVLQSADSTYVPGGGTSLNSSQRKIYRATHELTNATTEQAIFDNIPNVRDQKPGSTDTTDRYAAHLDAAQSNRTIGTALLLKVMAGDSFSVSAQSYYPSGYTYTNNITQSAFVSSLLTALGSSVSGILTGDAGTTTYLSNITSPSNATLYSAIPPGTDNTAIPQAYVNYVMFDENFNIIPEASGSIQIGATANAWLTIGTVGSNYINYNGYLSVFMSTMTSGAPVYIDNMEVDYYVGHLMDVNNYYPYGLPVDLSSALTPHPENKYLYQTMKQDKTNGLYLHDFGARQYDPQLGRFLGLDAANQFATGYEGMGCDPVSTIDPTGNDDEDAAAPDPAPSTEVQQTEDGKYHVKSVTKDGNNSIYLDHSNGKTTKIGETNSPDQLQKYAGTNAALSFDKDDEGTVRVMVSYPTANTNTASGSNGVINTLNNVAVTVNDFNPLAYAVDGISGLATGRSYQTGQPMTWQQSVASLGFAFMPWGGAEEKALVNATEKATYLVYHGVDPITGEIKYIGITGREASIRFAEHAASGTERATLRYEVIKDATNLSKTQARIIEQNLINQHGIDNLYNIRNSIAPKYWLKYGIK